MLLFRSMSEVETSAAALRYIAPLVPGYRLSTVCLLDLGFRSVSGYWPETGKMLEF